MYVLTYWTRSWLLSGFSFNTYVFLHGLVVHPYWVRQQVKESFCSFWPERLPAPGTSTSSTATPSAGTNQDEAHLHDNFDNCYPGEPWLHVKFYVLTICYASIAFVSIQIALSPSFNPEVRLNRGASISYEGVDAQMCSMQSRAISHPAQGQCTPWVVQTGGGAHIFPLDCKRLKLFFQLYSVPFRKYVFYYSHFLSPLT